MLPKKGRPKEKNPNTINLTIRINTVLNERLQDYCQKHETSKGEVVRKGIKHVLDADK